MHRASVGQHIADCLEALGVEYYLGYNGHGIWAILDALATKASLRGIQPKHEAAAVHIADGYFRRKHRLLPVLASIGPGSLNTVPAVANARHDSSAMALIVGASPTHYYDKGAIEEIHYLSGDDYLSVLRPLVKRAWYALRPDTAMDHIIQSFRIAGAGRPGPTLVYIPFDVQHQAVEYELPDVAKYISRAVPAGDTTSIEKAADLLSEAKRPLIIAGGGSMLSEAWKEFLCLIDTYQIPVATTLTGKGIVPEDHPLCLGPVGRAGWECSVKASRVADVILGLGCRFSDCNTSGWRPGVVYNIPPTRLIHVNIDPTDIGRNYPVDIPIIGDVKLVLRSLLEVLEPHKVKLSQRWAEWASQAKQWKVEWMKTLSSWAEQPPDESPTVNTIAWEVRKACPRDTLFCIDTGEIQQAFEAFGLIYEPNTFFNNAGMAQMGWATSAVLGVKLAEPSKPAVAIVGDGSFLMSAYSLATAVEYEIPVVWVLVNNHGLNIERHGQLLNYGREIWSTFTTKSGSLYEVDFMKLAESFGVQAQRVAKVSEIGPAVSHALRTGRPILVEVMTNRDVPTYFCPGITRAYPTSWEGRAYLPV